MIAHQRRIGLLLAVGMVAAFVGLGGLFGTSSASAAPPGAAQSLSVYEQRCLSNGNVAVTFAWNPSGQGTQWQDISTINNNFAFGWFNAGPLAASAYFLEWQLTQDTIYYTRVNTFTSQGFRASDTLPFRTISCTSAIFTPPHDVDAQTFNDRVRISWDRGADNRFFCVDTAFTESDLRNFRNSWRNWGCGTTGEVVDLFNLACGSNHYYRVWAQGTGTSGYSSIETFTSQPCAFSPPSDPRTQVLSSDDVRFRWDRGTNNFWFCLDIALTQDDLVDLDGSWTNAACGTTGTQVELSGVTCGATHYWRVWAAGPGTSGYSSIATFTTEPCDFEAPNNLNEDFIAQTAVELSWNEQDPAIWFCVDMAESQSDLLNFTGTWDNHDCGGTDEEAAVTGLTCATEYFWRVFAFAGNASGHSSIASFTTEACGP